jgi:signal transduction histidine kinase
MNIKKLYVLAVILGIASFCLIVYAIFRIMGPAVDSRHAAVLIAFGSLLALFAVAAAWTVSSDIKQQLSRVIQFLKEKTKVEGREGASIQLPMAYNEIGTLSLTLGIFSRKFRDEIKRNEEAKSQLNKIDEEKSHFLSVISHELRTPLNTILGFSQLLVEGTEGELSDSQKENIKIIQQSGKNLLSLINDILDLSELESGRLQINLQKTDIEKIIRSTIKEVSGQIRRKRTTITADFTVPPPAVRADPKRVYQIVMNLLNNAVKFTPKGEIAVRTKTKGEDFVEVQVQDAGYGISPQDLPFIFLEFRQAGSMGSRRKGSGLGLAICKRLVELQGGGISVESIPGKGSTFTFTLPVFKDGDEKTQVDAGAG